MTYLAFFLKLLNCVFGNLNLHLIFLCIIRVCMSMQMHLFILTICIHMYVCIGESFFVSSFCFQSSVSYSVIRGPGDGVGRRTSDVCFGLQHIL